MQSTSMTAGMKAVAGTWCKAYLLLLGVAVLGAASGCSKMRPPPPPPKKQSPVVIGLIATGCVCFASCVGMCGYAVIHAETPEGKREVRQHGKTQTRPDKGQKDVTFRVAKDI